MGFSNSGQIEELLLFGGAGFLIGIYGEVFYLLFSPSDKRSWRMALCDILFFVTAAFISFVFALAISDGVIRWYAYLGLGIGFASYRMTAGRLVRSSVVKLHRFIRQIAEKTREKAKKIQKKS